MTMASVQRVLKGDIIIDGGSGKNRMIPVRKVEYSACSSKGVHINGNLCYDSTAVVRLVDSEGTLGDLRDEIEEDFDPGVQVSVGETTYQVNPHLEHRHIPLGTVRVSEVGVNESDMDVVMDRIMAIADELVKP